MTQRYRDAALVKMESNRLDGKHQVVRNQYEEFPYPHREPHQEETRLIQTVGDNLDKIMHYCFRGQSRYRSHFRVLVAGGGTGDACIFLAEQLRNFPATLVYLDMSESSLKVAQRRAQVRGLDNIEWVLAPIQDLPSLRLGNFDYINCSGVIHHLKNPLKGLKTLYRALKHDGAINLMVYGKYGRRSVYEMQELMRLVNGAENSLKARIHNTKKVMANLPSHNPFRQSYQHWQTDIESYGDAGIVDLLLHAQDQSFSVPDLYRLCDEAQLNLVAFIGDYLEGPRGYLPESFIDDPLLLAKVKALSKRKQQAIAELISGSITKHTVYLSRQKDTVASIFDVDNIPFFSDVDADGMKRQAENLESPGIVVSSPKGDATFELDDVSRCLLGLVDGVRSIAEIVSTARQVLGEEEFEIRDTFLRLHELFTFFSHLDCMFLRQSEVPVLAPETRSVVASLV